MTPVKSDVDFNLKVEDYFKIKFCMMMSWSVNEFKVHTYFLLIRYASDAMI